MVFFKTSLHFSYMLDFFLFFNLGYFYIESLFYNICCIYFLYNTLCNNTLITSICNINFFNVNNTKFKT